MIEYNSERPYGIIKTLPTLYGDKTNAKEQFERSLKAIEAGLLDQFYVIFPGRPKHEVLYLYILIEGQIRVRVNIASIEPFDGELDCWDGSTRKAKYLAYCTAPVSYPPEPVFRKGFQGIRYCGQLW